LVKGNTKPYYTPPISQMNVFSSINSTNSINSDNAKRISLSPRTITTTNDDTVQKWGPLGTSVHYYTTKN
jgi:hypothetical protein